MGVSSHLWSDSCVIETGGERAGAPQFQEHSLIDPARYGRVVLDLSGVAFPGSGRVTVPMRRAGRKPRLSDHGPGPEVPIRPSSHRATVDTATEPIMTGEAR